ncbi:MAG TPA: phage holin family protein [Candidatus Cybelea sp.]|nr:phage holin family protein [Candidatus Cybelea sp.]
MNLLLRFIVNALVLYLICKYVPGFHIISVWGAVIAAVVFGLVNAIIGPILRLISLPLTLITLGLFSFVINYLLFVITAAFLHLNSGDINPWLANLYGAIIMMIVSTLMHQGSKSTEPAR